MNFASLKALSIPEGVVTKIEREGMVLFEVSSGVPIGDIPVGSSVYLKVNGYSTEFIVVQQGNPDSSMYDDTCDGTWLLMNPLYTKRAWDNSINDYEKSDIHAYLNGTFLGLLDSGIQAAVKQIKLPYQKGTGSGGSVVSGADGLPTKVFLLSAYEMGWSTSVTQYFPVDGSCLSYFVGTASGSDTKRVAYYSGSATIWWLRSPNKSSSSNVWRVSTTGNYSGAGCTGTYGVRPALVLPKDTMVDSEFNVIA